MSDATLNRVIDTIVHKWLRVPHVLNVGIDHGRKNAKVTVVFVHGLASSHKMWREVIQALHIPHARVMAVDLLGFGGSPKPEWQTYDAKVHARSLRMTLRQRQVRGPVIIVGHSLGSLVAVQYASMYPRAVSTLVLCSPPFYRAPMYEVEDVEKKLLKPILKQPDDALRIAYRYARNNPDLAKKLSTFIQNAKLLNPAFAIDDATLPAIVSSLEMSIENQTSLQDAEKLRLPVHIIYGRLDPFVLKRNLKLLEKNVDNVKIETLLAAHEIFGSKAFTKKVVTAVQKTAGELTGI